MKAIATLEEFLEGAPMGYSQKKKPAYIIYLRGVGTYSIVNGKAEMADDVADDVKATRVYHNIKGEKPVDIPKDLSIPKELKRPLTAEARKKMDAIVAENKNPTLKAASKDEAKRQDFLKPKGMSEEEWSKLRLEKEAKKREAAEKRRAEKNELKEARGEKRPSRDGLVAIDVIAKDLGLIAREARGFLRSAKYPKPDVGWAFPPDKVEEIKKLLKKAMGKEEEPKPAAKKKAAEKPAAKKKKGSK